MSYTKRDAQMTRGLAILCMVILHLFCRVGSDVLGTPLLWLNDTTPVVFFLGFFAEICVPLYSICAGYAQELLLESGKSSFVDRGRRILRLMGNYWIVLGLFCVLGLLFDPEGNIPGTMGHFAKSIFLLHSYNGAWWYLNTYVLLMLLPPETLFLPVRKLKLIPGLVFCGGFHVLWYLAEKLGFIPSGADWGPVLQFARKELVNLMGILPCVWVGGFLCRFRVMDTLGECYRHHLSPNRRKTVLLVLAILLFVGMNAVHKSVLMAPAALAVFLLFNLWEKGPRTQAAMLFLGKHSTNIWLVHMFFYAYFLKGLVLPLRYPLLMLGALLAWSVAASWVIQKIQMGIARIRIVL